MKQTEMELKWKAHPAKERIGATVVASVTILVISILIYASVKSFFWSLFAILILIFALNRFYFPSRFVIDSKGITARYPFKRLHYSWERVRRFRLDQYGGYLSTRKQQSRMDAYRGMHILFGKDRQSIVKNIKMLIKDI